MVTWLTYWLLIGLTCWGWIDMYCGCTEAMAERANWHGLEIQYMIDSQLNRTLVELIDLINTPVTHAHR